MSKHRDYTRMSQSEHEEVSVNLLVWFRDNQKTKIFNNEMDGSRPCGSQSKKIEDLIWCFFDDNRSSCGIKPPSSLMTVSELVEFISDKVLPVIANHRSDLLEKNWDGEWKLIQSEPDSNEDLFC